MPDNKYWLSHGSHTSAEDGRCAMEFVSYMAGEPHSDQPVCVSPVLRRFCIALNDRLPDEERQKLRPYLARTIGTAGDGLDEQRAHLCREFLLHQSLPFYLDKAGRKEAAQRLRELPADLAVEAVQREIQFARDEAWTARREARDRLAERIRAELVKRGYADAAAAAAAADAAAVDVAVDVAGAGAVADAGAVAVAVAVAAAGAVAGDGAGAVAVAVDVAVDVAGAAAAAVDVAADVDVAVAAAVDGAGAVAAAVAVAADVDVGGYNAVYRAVRNAVRERAFALAREWAAERNALMIPAAFDLLEQMLPTEVIQLPVVSDAEAVCGVPIRVGAA